MHVNPNRAVSGVHNIFFPVVRSWYIHISICQDKQKKKEVNRKQNQSYDGMSDLIYGADPRAVGKGKNEKGNVVGYIVYYTYKEERRKKIRV